MNQTLSQHVHRVAEPGMLYNMGNALGFVAGLAAALLAPHQIATVGATWWEITAQYLAGSPAAIALTIATVIFGIGGVVYSRAWANGAPPRLGLSRMGDILSALGASCLGYGLFVLGDPVLAVSAGLLHALGKLGSASGSQRQVRLMGRSFTLGDLCKDMVLFSRAPAILSAATGFAGDWVSLSVIGCCLLWGAADWMLLSPDGLIRSSLKAARGRPA